MSLKNFHILFISLSVLCSLGCGLWCLFARQAGDVPGAIAMGCVSLVLCVGLLVYGVFFLRKMSREKIV